MTGYFSKHLIALALLSGFLLLAACGGSRDSGSDGTATAVPAETQYPWEITPEVTFTPNVPLIALSLSEKDISIAPLPLRAGFPFSITATIHNEADMPAIDVPLIFYVSASQEEIGYTSFLQVLTVTVAASNSLPVTIPVNWNFAGGEYSLWVQVNRVPQAWQERLPVQPEENTDDNIVLLDLMINPFDAYASELCPGRVDVEISAADVLPEPGQQRVLVRVHNSGNRAVYNLPVIVTGEKLAGIAYTPAIPPCGGTAKVYVALDRPFQQGELLTVQINPPGWEGGLEEGNFDNNQVAVAAGLAPGASVPSASGLEDYDFSISAADVEIPAMWIVLVTVHNLGTRDAALVPIRVENEAGRKISDAIPLVQGNGLGVAAVRVGYLWTRGGTLTFIVNPVDHKDAYPETNRDNNVAIFTLP